MGSIVSLTVRRSIVSFRSESKVDCILYSPPLVGVVCGVRLIVSFAERKVDCFLSLGE